MANNPATRRAGAPLPVAHGNRLVRFETLPSASIRPSSTPPQTAEQSIPPATEIEETGGPTTLTVGAIADQEYLKRDGTDLVGANPLAGGISGTVPLAKLTGGGANGSLTVTNGLITAKTDPT